MAQGAAKSSVFKLDNLAGTVTDITPDLTSVKLSSSKGVIDVTTMGLNYKNYLAGIADAKISLEGVYDPTGTTKAGGMLDVMQHGSASQTFSWEWHPQGTAVGKPKLAGECLLESYSPGGGLDNAVTFSAELQNTGTVAVTTN